MNRRGARLLLTLGLAASLQGAVQASSAGRPLPAEMARGFVPLHAALHVHSTFSNGRREISEIAALARSRGIDVLGMTDSFLTEVRYGLAPWRKVASRSMARPAVLDHGLSEYRAACAAARAANPGLVVLPGLEVAPHYRWSGSPWSGLQLHDFDRHLLVFGLDDAGAVRDLPVVGNERWSNTPKEWTRAAGPALLLVAGAVVLAAGRPQRLRLMYFRVRTRARGRLVGAALVGAALLWLYDAYPFGRFSDPYSGAQETAAYQRVIDYVEGRGGLALWSYPEARYPDIEASGARMVSRRHPEDLVRTERYTGFEGLYGDTTTVTAVGNLWDRLLGAFAAGQQASWPVAIAGLDYHGTGSGGWKDLERGQTILWCREKGEAAVLDALRRGRFYAAFQGEPDLELGLADWALGSGGANAIAGETAAGGAGVTVTARLSWESVERTAPRPAAQWPAVDVELVRDGALLEAARVALPWTMRREEALPPGRHYYRLRAKSGTTELLSSPIFCEVR